MLAVAGLLKLVWEAIFLPSRSEQGLALLLLMRVILPWLVSAAAHLRCQLHRRIWCDLWSWDQGVRGLSVSELRGVKNLTSAETERDEGAAALWVMKDLRTCWYQVLLISGEFRESRAC